MRVSTQPGEYSESNSESDSGPASEPNSEPAGESNGELASEPNGSPGAGLHPGALRNGLVGGVVAVLLSFLPLSQVLGGGVAGYLERGAGRRGHTAGVVAGLVAALPFLVVATYLVLSPGVALPGPALEASRAFVVAGVAAVAVVYAVGLSALGSLLGSSLRDER